MPLDDADVIAHLEAENFQLRRMIDDERRHVAVLRETVRELQNEVARLRGNPPNGDARRPFGRSDVPPPH
jgi:hypothetical protein